MSEIVVILLSLLLLLSSAHTAGVEMIKNIFILAGQSNMSGRGLLAENYPEFNPSPLIRRFAANRTWEEAQDPLHGDIDTKKLQGRGPGMPFANHLLEREPGFGVIGLVPCALGDTSIGQWSKGSNDSRHLYDTMISRARAAVSSSGGGGAIRALLWNQGEFDTKSPDLANTYTGKFEKFVQDVRADLGLPSLPVIEVALPQKNEDFPNTDTVRKAQFEAAAELQNVSCVDARNCTIETRQLKMPPVHLTSGSQKQLGIEMADAFLALN